MASLVQEAVNVTMSARDPWPNDVKLYQPYQVSQTTLPDFASCMSVKAFLRMSGLDYQDALKPNAEHMSPSGRVPFIKAGHMIVSELEPIISYVQAKGHSLSESMNEEERADMKAYMVMIDNVFLCAENYLTWCVPANAKLSAARYGSPYAWPLSMVLPRMKRSEVKAALGSRGWADKTVQEVYDELRTCCQALAEKLGEQDFLFGYRPTDLDALLYGHLYANLTMSLPDSKVPEIIDSFPNLADFCARIDQKYFVESELNI